MSRKESLLYSYLFQIMSDIFLDKNEVTTLLVGMELDRKCKMFLDS